MNYLAEDKQVDDMVVVVNAEGQYSIWRLDLEIPPGWSSVGVSGTKAECLEYIEKVWTDMRPLSLRRLMEGDQTAKAK